MEEKREFKLDPSAEALFSVGRLLIDEPTDCFLNMAIDEALLLSCQRGEELSLFPTIRFYQWSTPTLSLGYAQRSSQTVDRHYCRGTGVKVVRRITGGRAVLHHREVTYSVVACTDSPPFCGAISETYLLLSRAIMGAYTSLGIAAEMAGKGEGHCLASSPMTRSPCFYSPSRHELVYQGKKLVGSAQKRQRNSFLQHGSILLDFDSQLLLLATAQQPGMKLPERVTSIKEILRREVSPDELIEKLVASFQKTLRLRLLPGELTSREREVAQRLCEEKYSQDAWNYLR
ncbi:octanoyltransferase [bacterium (candidate division B38) B3_B38]|nr:MAG: octanoyltransferase [bacterium (candidate division B38) B3_B38]